jgi:haloalkane dehalogenase
VTVLLKGAHFLQEEVPDEVGAATARFASKALAGQIG